MSEKLSPPSNLVHKVFSAIRKALRSFETQRTEDHASWHLTIQTDWDPIDNLWIAECRELPGCMSQGETEAEALENITDAIGGVLIVRIQANLQQDLSASTTRLTEAEDGQLGRTVAICV